MTGDGVALGFGYDGELPTSTSVTWPETTAPMTLTYDYDAAFQLSGEHLNGVLVASYTRDLDGLMSQAGALSLTRDGQSGKLTTATLQSLSTNYSYNAAQLPAGRTTALGSALLYDEQVVSRDEGGRILERTENVLGEQHRYEYVYDARGRLTRVTRDGVLLRTYGCDSNDNRLQLAHFDPNAFSESGSSGSATYENATYDAQDRLVTIETLIQTQSLDGIDETRSTRAFSYDADGFVDTWTDQCNGATTDLNYDAQGSLRSVTLPDGRVVSYEIDAMQRRVGRRVDDELTARWVYRDTRHPAAELDAYGNVVATFIYAEEANVPSYMVKNGANYRVLSDLGSVRLVVDAQTGQVAQRMDYDEFGRVVNDTNPGFQPFGFAGGLYDADTSLVRFGARDYDAVPGRWTARDPVLFRGGSANLYQYVHGDPNNRIDPSGLWDIFFGVEGDLVGGNFGAEGAFGVLFDTDHPLESGIFRTIGPAAGANVGLSVCGGAVVRDIEGFGSDIDANIGKWSPSILFDDEGVNGASIGVGPGLGVSIAQGYTTTTTVQDALDTVVGWFQ